ncbi:MAG TPA: sigma-70 family RNA polymerase sigma factor [Spirochaetia bacterium]|nr:sigma-70 family RNA polymerase sigma factor [Spirochaetia bacterium]
MVDVEALYRKYGPMVVRRCRQILHDEDKALDAAQDVFVRLIRHQDQLDQSAPSSLLYRIATNVCLNVLRSERRKPQTHDDEILQAIAGVDDPAETVINTHLLERLFHREHESTRVIAVLHYVDRLTLEETAAEVGLSVSGVRKRLRRLREKGLVLKEAG